MKFVVTSDWHLGERVKGLPQLARLLDTIGHEQPDAVLVLGDFYWRHDAEVLKKVCLLLGSLTCPVGVVFGNHDVWLSDRLREKGKTSWDILNRACDTAEEAGLCPLDRRPLPVGDLWIVGSIGWYDYSLGSAFWSIEQYAQQRLGNGIWQDLTYVNWTASDPDVCSEFIRRLAAQMQGTPTGCEIVAATHVAALPSSPLITGDPQWDFFNAFMGTRQIERLLVGAGVRLHLFGHAHSEERLIPEIATAIGSKLVSYNACYYPSRPYLLVERANATDEWMVLSGMKV